MWLPYSPSEDEMDVCRPCYLFALDISSSGKHRYTKIEKNV